jgi:hypothetical protein
MHWITLLNNWLFRDIPKLTIVVYIKLILLTQINLHTLVNIKILLLKDNKLNNCSIFNILKIADLDSVESFLVNTIKGLNVWGFSEELQQVIKFIQGFIHNFIVY